MKLLRIYDWHELDIFATSHLEQTKGRSYKAFFYLGVSLYKTKEYESAIKAFQRAEEINPEDAQLHYNLGLANFKLEQYN